MANKLLIQPDFEGVVFLSNLVDHFTDFNEDMKQHIELIQEASAFNVIIDDYFFEYNCIDDILDNFNKLQLLVNNH